VSVFDKACGKFTVTVSDGWPMWVKLGFDGADLGCSIRSTDLYDLRYLVDRAIAAAEEREARP
jgi:hypothetical protein